MKRAAARPADGSYATRSPVPPERIGCEPVTLLVLAVDDSEEMPELGAFRG